jgi:NAD(P)H-dependent FMN reductase
MRVLLISGSLREGSTNSATLRTARAVSPNGIEATLYEGMGGLPHYNPDAVGLLAGFAVPALGTAAAIGLVVYFICAVTAHLRVRDRGIGGAVFFLVLAAAA